MDRQARLQQVAIAAGFGAATAMTPIESYSNETYHVDHPLHGPAVLRICWQGNPERLLVESRVAGVVGPEIGYPDVLAFGRVSDGPTWSLVRALDGCPLGQVWHGLDERARDQAGAAVANLLRSLHSWRPDASLAGEIVALSRFPDPVTATINPLPITRLRKLWTLATTLPESVTSTVARARTWIEDHALLAPVFDDPRCAVTHGDLHFNNLWWYGSQVSGLIDLEWIRFAPAYVELARIAENAMADIAEDTDAHQHFLRVVLRHYPELGEIDGFGDRLKVCVLAGLVRQLLVWPELTPNSPNDHPAHLLEQALDDGGWIALLQDRGAVTNVDGSRSVP